MTTLAYGGSQFDSGRVATRAAGVIRARWKTFGLLSLVLGVAPGVLFGDLPGLAPRTAASDLLDLIGSLLILAASIVLDVALIHGTVEDLNGRTASSGDMLAVARRLFWPSVGLVLVSVLCICLGLVLLIVPGVLLALAWSAALPALVIEQRGVQASFRRSLELTRGRRAPILGLYLLAAVAAVVAVIVLGLVLMALRWLPGGLVIEALASAAIGAAVAALNGVLAGCLYQELVDTRPQAPPAAA